MKAASHVWLSLLAIWLTASATLAADRIALVIGNSDYEAVTPLENPQHDALDVSVALEGLGFDVLLGRDLSREAMRKITNDFANAAQEADVALFYYAGHGFQVEGQNYLIPTDAVIGSPSDVTTQTVAMTTILQSMQETPGLKLIFLDACRDNPFGASLKDNPATGRGLARIGTEVDFMFAYATQPGNVAYDGTGRNSFFTKALLHHLYTPGQPLADLMIAVRRDVIAATGGQQIPWENSSLTRQFVFDDGPPDLSEETLFYQVAADLRDAELMRLYLDNYPEGVHVGDALAYLETGTRTRSLETPDAAAQAEKLWELAQRSRVRPLLEFYVERYPQGDRVDEAKRLLALIPKLQDSRPGALCARLATHPRDAIAGTPGVPFERLQQSAISAIRACSAAVIQSPNLPHYIALLARATAASGDLAGAIDLYETAAERGDLRAMVSLAQLKENGTGIPQDIPSAMELYEQASRGGSADAMINLAIALFEGKDLPQDTSRAIALLKRASQSGSAKATFNLGVLAQDGAVDDPADALDYFRRAAQDGEYEGYRAAAILLDEGRGVGRDPAEAATMLLRGAVEDQGAILADLTEHSSQWSKETIAQVQLRLASAGIYTGNVDGLPGPNFALALRQWRNGKFDASALVN